MHTKHGHGEGSSPALQGDTLVVNWDHEEQSFIVALDKNTGNQLWRRDRREVTSWSSPLIVKVGNSFQVIVCGTERVRGYDLATGDVIWQCGGLSANIVATPVAASGVVYVGSSYEKRALLAIQLDGASGDVTDTEHVLWMRTRGTPYVPSPLLYDDALYFLTHYQNVMTRIEAKTGIDDPGAFRLGPIGNIYASPVGGGGRVYVTDVEGKYTGAYTRFDPPHGCCKPDWRKCQRFSSHCRGPDFPARGKTLVLPCRGRKIADRTTGVSGAGTLIGSFFHAVGFLGNPVRSRLWELGRVPLRIVSNKCALRLNWFIMIRYTFTSLVANTLTLEILDVESHLLGSFGLGILFRPCLR